MYKCLQYMITVTLFFIVRYDTRAVMQQLRICVGFKIEIIFNRLILTVKFNSQVKQIEMGSQSIYLQIYFFSKYIAAIYVVMTANEKILSICSQYQKNRNGKEIFSILVRNIFFRVQYYIQVMKYFFCYSIVTSLIQKSSSFLKY